MSQHQRAQQVAAETNPDGNTSEWFNIFATEDDEDRKSFSAEKEWRKLQLLENALAKGPEGDKEEEFSSLNLNPKLIEKETANVVKEEIIETQNATVNPERERRVINRLYNMEVTFRIPGINDFKVQAILDTGASACCINEGAVPKKTLEPSAYPTQITEVNSQQISTLKLKYGKMVIDENKFPIPFTYAFPMREKNGTQLLIGCNFIRAMQGGLRIEGQTVTFYKNVTTITTKVDTIIATESAIQELDLAEPEYLEIKEVIAYDCGK